MGDLPAGVSIADAIAAFHTVESFWVALSNDDDQLVHGLLVPDVLELNGWTPKGLARQVRSKLAVTAGQCASMGTSNRVRILADGGLAFWSMPVWHDTLIDAPTLVAGWGWRVERAEGDTWRLSGMPDSADLRAAPQFSLPDTAIPEPTSGRGRSAPSPAKAAAAEAKAAAAEAKAEARAEAKAAASQAKTDANQAKADAALAKAAPQPVEARPAPPKAAPIATSRPEPVAPPRPEPVAQPPSAPDRPEPRPAPVRVPDPAPAPAPSLARPAPAPAPVESPPIRSKIAPQLAQGLPPEPLSPNAVRKMLGLPDPGTKGRARR